VWPLQSFAGPVDVVKDFYTVRIQSGITGAPTPEQLELIAPYLSAELQTLLRKSRELHDREAKEYPDEKPAFTEGDLFSSLFEGPTSFEIIYDELQGDIHRVSVRFTYTDEQGMTRWTDNVLVRPEDDHYVITDIEYLGDWDFSNKGTLLSSLRNGLAE
jgi:hypothetical protein